MDGEGGKGGAVGGWGCGEGAGEGGVDVGGVDVRAVAGSVCGGGAEGEARVGGGGEGHWGCWRGEVVGDGRVRFALEEVQGCGLLAKRWKGKFSISGT